jgi:hypothetical protein
MTTTLSSPSYKGYRFPAEIISHALWLYYRFSLSYRDVEELIAECGIVLTYETIHQWCQKFGQHCARVLRRRRAQKGMCPSVSTPPFLCVRLKLTIPERTLPTADIPLSAAFP